MTRFIPTHADLQAWLATRTIRGAAIDKALLESCIAEAAGDDAEMATFLRERYAKNEALAARFVGGFTRTADYTQKTQALSAKEKELGTKSADLEKQLTAVRSQLTAADTEKAQIMKDLATHRVSTARARELFTILKEKYELTDDDLPGMSDLIETAKKGKVVDSSDDLETRLATLRADITKEVEERFTKTLIPELGSMASLPIIWNDIGREHFELTGKHLTFAEQQDILKSARAGEGSLRDVWETKYQIKSGDWGDGLRLEKRFEARLKDHDEKREKEEAEKRSKDALNVVTGQRDQPDLGTGPGVSAAFKTRFRTFEMDPQKAPVADNGGVPSLSVKPGEHVRQTGDRGPTGAQRAAAKFLASRGTKAA
jgi:outer membrane murein-binding lipoprotein Lpp